MIFNSINKHWHSVWFSFSLGNSCGTMLFEGQSGHLVPSNSKVLVQNDMYIMAGRMIGHAFLHSGPRLTGLSPAVKHVLAGGTPQTATIALEDITDIDVRETLGPVSKGECTTHSLTVVISLMCWQMPGCLSISLEIQCVWRSKLNFQGPNCNILISHTRFC